MEEVGGIVVCCPGGGRKREQRRGRGLGDCDKEKGRGHSFPLLDLGVVGKEGGGVGWPATAQVSTALTFNSVRALTFPLSDCGVLGTEGRLPFLPLPRWLLPPLPITPFPP